MLRVAVEGIQQPDGGVVDFFGERMGELARRAAIGVFFAFRAEGVDAGPRRVPGHRERTAEVLRKLFQPTGIGRLQHQVQPFRGLVEPVGDLLVDDPSAAPGRELDRARREFAGGRRGHPVHQVVCLVHQDDVVVGQHRPVVQRVDGQQGVVRHDDVGTPGLGPGALGEAVDPGRAAVHAEALLGGDRQLPPGLVGYARHELVAVAGFGLGGPFLDPLDLPFQRRRREGVEQGVVVGFRGRVAVHAVQAQVVAAALEDREGRPSPERFGQCRGEPGQVPVDELALQRDGRGRDDHGGAFRDGVPDRRDQVRQRLPGAGPGLHGQMLAGADGVLDRFGHPGLPVAWHAADRFDRDPQQGRQVRDVVLGLAHHRKFRRVPLRPAAPGEVGGDFRWQFVVFVGLERNRVRPSRDRGGHGEKLPRTPVHRRRTPSFRDAPAGQASSAVPRALAPASSGAGDLLDDGRPDQVDARRIQLR